MSYPNRDIRNYYTTADPRWYRRPSLRVFILKELNAAVGAVWLRD